jgi:hypothetical protein
VSDEIQAVEVYRGVNIDDCQPADRIESVVKRAIDTVFVMTDLQELARYAGDITRPPEARLFAAAKCHAMFQIAAADRVVRPEIRLHKVTASVAGLNSRIWRSPTGFGSCLDVPPPPGQPGHQPRPPEYGQQVEDDKGRRREDERAEGLRPRRATDGG